MLQKAISKVDSGEGQPEDEEPAALQDDGDLFQQLRVKQAQHRREALEWLGGGDPYHDVLLLRVSLEGEIALMADIVRDVGAVAELKAQSHFIRETGRPYRICKLAEGALVRKHIAFTLDAFADRALWAHMTSNQAAVSDVWATLVRSPAVLYTLVAHKSNCNPTRLFRLLLADRASEAQRLLSAPPCVLDAFARSYREQFNTLEALNSEAAVQVLFGLAQMAETCTLSTEVLHSRNARRLRTRVHSHPMDLSTMAAAHQRSATCSWLELLQEHQKDHHRALACEAYARGSRSVRQRI